MGPRCPGVTLTGDCVEPVILTFLGFGWRPQIRKRVNKDFDKRN